MNELKLIPLLKDYVQAEGAEQIENILAELSNITGFEHELVFDAIHSSFPCLHDIVINELKQENVIRSIPVHPLF
ncbi:MAG: hypothetical protein KME29_15520 [Calothrix sp. FI2-JRJ7]|jgi:hypothetical protein|nr:hypothetical protein [Calothrix sp. FI2-JRJ7]